MADKVNEYIDAITDRWSSSSPLGPVQLAELRQDFHGVARKMLELQREGYFTPAQDSAVADSTAAMREHAEVARAGLEQIKALQEQNERMLKEQDNARLHMHANAALNGLLVHGSMSPSHVVRQAFDLARMMLSEGEACTDIVHVVANPLAEITLCGRLRAGLKVASPDLANCLYCKGAE